MERALRARWASRSFLQRWQFSCGFPAIAAFVWTALTCSLIAAPVPTGQPGSYPSWWFEREVIPQRPPAIDAPVWPDNYPAADDFAAVNLGQLKQAATAAYDELIAHLPGGPGPTVDALIKGWFLVDSSNNFILDANGQRQPLTTADSFTVINLGQIKAVAQAFYDQLIAAHYCTGYPWGTGTPDDFAAANLGQLKYLFSFDLTYSSLGDGIPDWWKLAAGLSPNDPNAFSTLTGNNTLVDANGQSITYLTAYQMGYDPTTAATSDPENNPAQGQGDPLHQMGTTTYAAIDVSSSLTQADIDIAAIDDTGRVGFAYDTQDTAGNDIHNGASFFQGQTSLTESFADAAAYLPDGTGAMTRMIFGVNAAGNLGGYLYSWLGSYVMLGSGVYPSFGGGSGDDPNPFGLGSFGIIGVGNSITTGDAASYHFEISGGAAQWISVDWDKPFLYFDIFSPGGIAAGYTQTLDNPPKLSYIIGDYNNQQSVGQLYPMAVNDDYLVVGDNTSITDRNGSNDSLSFFNGTTTQPLSSLLPDQYAHKIRFPGYARPPYSQEGLPPKAWLNTSGDIIVTAEVLNQSVPNSTTWVPCTLLMRDVLDRNQNDTSKVSFVTLPDNTALFQFNAEDDFAAIAAVANTDSSGNPLPDGSTHEAAVLLLTVDITVIDFIPTKDTSEAGVTEPNATVYGTPGVDINPGTIKANGTIAHISVGGKSLPKAIRDKIASNYEFGLIQNVVSTGRTANYPATQEVEVFKHGQPRLDMAPNAVSGVPWAYTVVHFSEDDQDRILSNWEDTPRWNSPYDDPLVSKIAFFLDSIFRWDAIRSGLDGLRRPM